MKLNISRFQFWSAATVSASVTLLYLCLTPMPPQIDGPLGWDKLQHAVAFGFLTFLLFKSLEAHKISTLFSSFFAFFGAALFGGLIELLQGWLTVNRKAEWLDFAADSLGALTVTIFLHQFYRTRGSH